MSRRHLPAERSDHRDPSTGANVTRWTRARATNQHLLGSYVYPHGGSVGMSKASPCLDAERNRLFYVRDDAVDLDDATSGEMPICPLPPGWFGAYTHLSPGGATLCVPVTDPRAVGAERTQWEQLRAVPARMAAQDLVTRIYLVDVARGQARVPAETPFWVTHVQFDPSGTGRIVFNLEGQDTTGAPLPQRIWCLEPDGAYRPLAEEPAGEWRSHENWAPDGGSVVYHGARDGKAFVAARTWEGRLLQETSIDGIQFWHTAGAIDGKRLFADRKDGMISLLDPEATTNRLVDLCGHDTSYDDQDAHAHPFTTPDGASVVFTSNRTGNCEIYEVPAPTGRQPERGRPRLTPSPGPTRSTG